jgi:hypothetical protein
VRLRIVRGGVAISAKFGIQDHTLQLKPFPAGGVVGSSVGYCTVALGEKVADDCPRTLSKVTELKPFYFSSFNSPKPIQL